MWRFWRGHHRHVAVIEERALAQGSELRLGGRRIENTATIAASAMVAVGDRFLKSRSGRDTHLLLTRQ
jgi:hypothetical protein